VVQVAGSR
jgi:SRSO17 transposase